MNPTHFVYVYVLYYYNPNETDLFERLHEVQPAVFATRERAMMAVAEPITVPVQEINRYSLWRIGNYWIHRLPIIPDHTTPGLEHEVVDWTPYNSKLTDRVPLPEDSSDSTNT